MASLDKSLDDIISSTKRGKKFIPKRPAKKTGLTGGKASKNLISKKKVTKPTAKQAERLLDASYATKVVVYGLPKDLSSDAVKEFFQSQVGNVQNVGLSYNEKGRFKGIATIIFSKEKAAAKAVTKYNGAPIDGGSTKLKLELIVDPTKRPLASRIGSNDQAKPKPLQARIKAAKKAAAPVATKKAAPKKKPAKKPKKEKKTVEQLDQEMTDYFDNSGN